MLQKRPKSNYWKIVKTSAKVIFVAEAIAFAASYGIWYRMNTNSDFRHYMNNNFPIVLEGYYKVGELLGKNFKLRQNDLAVWDSQEKSTTKDK